MKRMKALNVVQYVLIVGSEASAPLKYIPATTIEAPLMKKKKEPVGTRANGTNENRRSLLNANHYYYDDDTLCMGTAFERNGSTGMQRKRTHSNEIIAINSIFSAYQSVSSSSSCVSHWLQIISIIIGEIMSSSVWFAPATIAKTRASSMHYRSSSIHSVHVNINNTLCIWISIYPSKIQQQQQQQNVCKHII